MDPQMQQRTVKLLSRVLCPACLRRPGKVRLLLPSKIILHPPPTAKIQSKLDRVRRQKILMMIPIGARMVQRQRRSPLAAALAVNQTGRVMRVVLDLSVVVAANEAGRVVQVVDLSLLVVQAHIRRAAGALQTVVKIQLQGCT
jgi:hypothetical protein